MARVQHFETAQDIIDVRQWLTDEGKVREAELVVIGCHIGLRIGDLLRVTFADIDSGWLKVTEEKTGNKRDPIPINKVVAESAKILKEWYATQFPNRTIKYLFQATSNRSGNTIKPVSSRNVHSAITEATSHLKIDGNFGTHSLRKTFGHNHYKRYQDIAALMALFGHTSPVSTFRYIGITTKKTNKMYMEFDLLNAA